MCEVDPAQCSHGMVNVAMAWSMWCQRHQSCNATTPTMSRPRLQPCDATTPTVWCRNTSHVASITTTAHLLEDLRRRSIPRPALSAIGGHVCDLPRGYNGLTRANVSRHGSVLKVRFGELNEVCFLNFQFNPFNQFFQFVPKYSW